MFHFLTENAGTILLSIFLAAAVIGVIVHLVRKKRRGESSCSCSCNGCPGHCRK